MELNEILQGDKQHSVTIQGVYVKEEENELIDASISNIIHKKCDILNSTNEESIPEMSLLDSTYLNNIYSSFTTNLIEDRVPITEMEVEGFDLFDIVKSNCGSAKICTSFRGNFSDSNIIVIGFLSAYGWSQVSLF